MHNTIVYNRYMTSLFDPIRIGSMDLPQRFVMAPLTRNRAGAGMAPTPLTAEYYGQRAGAGLIIAEGSQPSWTGQGYLNSPGMHGCSGRRMATRG